MNLVGHTQIHLKTIRFHHLSSQKCIREKLDDKIKLLHITQFM